MYKSRTFASLILLMMAFFPASNALADDIKEIAQLSTQGQSVAALDRINLHLLAYPKDVQALFLKGVILADLKKVDEAIKIFKEVTEKNPNLPEPYNNLAVLYADKGQYDKAQKALEAAIKTHPSYATAHENLGDVYAKMASEAYDKALKLDNNNTSLQGKLSLIKELVPTASRPTSVASKVTPKAPGINAASTAKATVPPIAAAIPAKPKDSTALKAAPVIKPAVATAVTEPSKASNNDKEIELALGRWANAWAEKNMNAYLASYANSFKTPAGVSRKEWEKSRRERINRPAKISVQTDHVRISQEDDKLVKVTFNQSYRADGVNKFTPKTLVMKNIGGKWLIEQELTNH